MRKLAIFSFSFAAAAAAYVYFLPPRWALYLAACLAPAALLPIKRAVRLRIGAFGLAVGFLWSWGYERLRIYPLREYCGYATELSATVCAAPEETDGGCRTVVRVGDGKLLLYLNCPPQSVRIGDRVHVWARVEDVSRGTQDKERNLYYPSCDISLVGFAHGEAEIVPQSPALRDLPAAAAVRVRERITKLFPPDVEGFLRGLLTGDRSGMSYELRNRLSLTGLSHVVSVSGMHVSLLFGVLLALCRRRRALTVLLSVPLLTFFAAMLGFTPSVTRAVVMNTIVLCAPLAGREEDQPTTLGFALLVILLANPWAVANVSLQLSFLAMAGIFLLAGPMHRRLCGLLPKALQKSRCLFARALRAVLLIVSVSMSVQTVSLPLAAWYFGMVSLLAPLTNLLCVSLIAAVFTLSCGALALSLCSLPLGCALGGVIALPVRLCLSVTKLLARFPLCAVYTSSPYITAWLAATCLLIALAIWKRRVLPSLLGICAGLAAALLFSFSTRFSLTLMDVGQGQTVVLQDGRQTAVIDCGGDREDYYGERLARQLLAQGKTRVDVLLLTHFDSDHTCGTAQLLARLPVGVLLVPDMEGEGREAILACADAYGVPVRVITEDVTMQIAGTELQIMAPESAEGNNGLAALMSRGTCDILVTGDMDIEAEERLLQTHTLPELDVLVAGHHGAATSTGEALLEATQPRLVLISAGEGNSYGHPSAQTLARLADIPVLRTDQCGDIVITR